MAKGNKICPACDGTGQVMRNGKLVRCAKCNGTGEVPAYA